MKDFTYLGGPLALVAHSPLLAKRTPQYPHIEESSYQVPYDNTLQSYEADTEMEEEEAFQNALALVSQQFNRLPHPFYCKNQQFTSLLLTTTRNHITTPLTIHIKVSLGTHHTNHILRIHLCQ